MANPTKTDDIKKTTANGEDDFAGASLNLNRLSFKPELYTERVQGTQKERYVGDPVIGKVVGFAKVAEMLDEQTGELRDWEAYIVELEKDCNSCSNRAKETVIGKAGEEIFVSATSVLAQAIPEKVANHPTQMLRVKIQPLERTPHDGGKKKLWSYTITPAIRNNPVPRPASAAAVIHQMAQSSEAATAKLLEAGDRLVSKQAS